MGSDIIFKGEKDRILQQLNTPAENYSDASPKGSLDDGIRDLVDAINAIDGLVTTSSCAGRVSVFLEGRKKGLKPVSGRSHDEDKSQPAIAGAGGKGGGQWLFVSHEPFDTSNKDGDRVSYLSLFGIQEETGESEPLDLASYRLVHFKFEPMILHIMTCSLDDAQRVVSSALQAGFRESGIMSVTIPLMVAVRSSGMSLDSIVGYEDGNGIIRSIVDENYFRGILSVINERFSANQERIGRFQHLLLSGYHRIQRVASTSDSLWEDAAVRRERKRREGLMKQQSLRSTQNPPAAPPEPLILDTSQVYDLTTLNQTQ
ncbi:hypothetical protein NA57DRAFT_76919 [Rhizodiscina lignyota]|uniref:tRNA(Phe) 7-[(3-amino-3-carboxypropyl)-4-demethylwyosine(37)-N(4)]-methyltransferase n=1 Tax=Rhizodiscina lignyota TaxID=1504668 RepID=A0A9P4M9U3_9PEZI|nr:hypothetical protein NA57DRAFT_76919 [Rhizodiscina lignyota]